MTVQQYAAVVLVLAPQGVPCVKDWRKRDPLWKLPGGGSEGLETAAQCASRELEGETGICVAPEDLRLIDAVDKGTHILTFFVAEVSSLDGLLDEGDEGEEVRVLQPEEILESRDFLHSHHTRIAEILRERVQSRSAIRA